MAPASSQEFLDIHANYRVWIHFEPRTWYDNNIQSNPTHRQVLTTQLDHLASFVKCFSVHLRTNWVWFGISLLSLQLQIWLFLQEGSYFTFKQTIEYGFTLKCLRDMTITYSQIQRTNKYSEHSSIIWAVWLHGWVFVYVLSGYG